MSNRHWPKRIAIGALCVVGALSSAWAHHAASNFDQSKQYIFRGVVKRFMWQNPHAWVYVEVTKKEGTKELWGFEGAGTNMLARSGWKASSLKGGDKVTVYGSPERDGKRNAIMHKIVLADGTELGGNPPPDAPQGPPSAAPPGAAPASGPPGMPPQSEPVEY